MRGKVVLMVLFSSYGCGVYAQDAATQEVTRDIAEKISEVSSFSATVVAGEDAGDGLTSGPASSLLVSKDYGWKVLAKEGNEAYQLVTDYTTFFQYYPNDKRALKSVASKPEEKLVLRKPATDMNPVALLDPPTIRFEGKEVWAGETVYRISGTTESQLMPGGPPVKRHVVALIGEADGLPRKTSEGVGISTGTTVYSNVILNPKVKPEDFQFVPPEGITVIDSGAGGGNSGPAK